MRIYVGTYTRNTASEGIYLCEFDPTDGRLELVGLAAETENPSYLAWGRRRSVLYACNELNEFQEQPGGGVSALTVQPLDGTLRLLNRQPTLGADPCHVSVDRSGAMVMVANYSGGSLAAYAVQPDGSLAPPSCTIRLEGSSVDARRQDRPHAHSLWPDPTNRWALLCDLGSDLVRVYALSPQEAQLRPAPVPAVSIQAGCGPRHLTFHPNGRWVYVVNEIVSSVSVFAWDATAGTLQPIEHVPALPADHIGENSAADVHLTPDGRFLYASNRGQDALAMWRVEQTTGRLTLLGYEPTLGKHPRNFAIDPSGRWLLVANMHSDSIVAFAIDDDTGRLTPSGFRLDLPSPCCLLINA